MMVRGARWKKKKIDDNFKKFLAEINMNKDIETIEKLGGNEDIDFEPSYVLGAEANTR